MRSSYFCNGKPYNGKMAFLHGDGPSVALIQVLGYGKIITSHRLLFHALNTCFCSVILVLIYHREQDNGPCHFLLHWLFKIQLPWWHEYNALCLLVLLGGWFSYIPAIFHPWLRLRGTSRSTLIRKPLCEPTLAYHHLGKNSVISKSKYNFSQIYISNVVCKISAILFRQKIINHSSAALVYTNNQAWSALHLQMS